MKQGTYPFLCVWIIIVPSTGQIPTCPPVGEPQFPHPNCTLFYFCANGHPKEIACSVGLYYNPKTTLCDYPANVPECIEGTRAPLPSISTTMMTTEPTTTEEPTTESSSTTTRATTTVPPPPGTCKLSWGCWIKNLTFFSINPFIIAVTRCGQTIQADSGLIQYKLNQNYDAGELCACIVRMNEYDGCTFTLEAHGFSPFDPNAITILAENSNQPLRTYYLGPNTGSDVTISE